jgi:hypothetical protein
VWPTPPRCHRACRCPRRRAVCLQEAEGNLDGAEQLCKEVVAEVPSNQVAAKRLIAIARQRTAGLVGRARDTEDERVLQQLNTYLETFGTDVEAVRLSRRAGWQVSCSPRVCVTECDVCCAVA